LTREEWKDLARRRIQRILGVRRVASKRQLEAKISEAGPGRMRANPHHVSAALDDLLGSGQVITAGVVSANIGRSTALYAPSNWDETSPVDGERIQRVRAAYQEFLTVTLREDDGKSLETVVQGAIEQSNQFHWLTPAGRPPSAGFEISGVPITGPQGALDHYLIHKHTGILVGVEDKNYRDWFYPTRFEIKQLLKKCHAYNMLPVLVTRKVHFTTRVLFHHLGALAFQTHNQCFATKYADRLVDVRHKDGLGFADMRFTDEPLPHIVRLFSDLLPRLIDTSWEKFNANRELIEAFSEEEIDYPHLLSELGLTDLDDQYDEDEEEGDDPGDLGP